MTITLNSMPKDDEEFLRWLVFPHEERRHLTSAPWRGEYRWFRSANVVALERYRNKADWARIRAVLQTR
jgi:hypothetical protein